MRVIGGRFRGKRIQPKWKLKARPTTEFAREGLFNILQHKYNLEGIEVLDLFTGSGAVSLEFVSRGAASVTSIDTDRNAIRHIHHISKELELDEWKAYRVDVFSMLKKNTKQFDIIFADPPFALEKHEELVDIVLNGAHLKERGWLILEHPKRMAVDSFQGFDSSRNYGNLTFSFFKAQES